MGIFDDIAKDAKERNEWPLGWLTVAQYADRMDMALCTAKRHLDNMVKQGTLKTKTIKIKGHHSSIYGE